jgi:hypothetical protein
MQTPVTLNKFYYCGKLRADKNIWLHVSGFGGLLWPTGWIFLSGLKQMDYSINPVKK